MFGRKRAKQDLVPSVTTRAAEAETSYLGFEDPNGGAEACKRAHAMLERLTELSEREALTQRTKRGLGR